MLLSGSNPGGFKEKHQTQPLDVEVRALSGDYQLHSFVTGKGFHLLCYMDNRYVGAADTCKNLKDDHGGGKGH
jgi:hypothetical protein